MMGATGALETLFLVQAIREGILPPTINYETPDPVCDLDYIPNKARDVIQITDWVCDLDYIPNKAREKKIHVAVSNSFGFGGHNAVIVVRKYG